MNLVVFAMYSAPLPMKLVIAGLAGLLPAVLSGRLQAAGRVSFVPYLMACGLATGAAHSVVYLDPGVVAALVGLFVGFVVFVLAPSGRASFLAATTVAAAALLIIGTTVFLRMPPSDLRSAITQIRRYGGVVQQSDNPGTTYRDQWSVTFEQAGISDTQLLELASDLETVPKLWLTLSNCPVSDRGLAALANANNLAWLKLDGTNITDAGMPHLATLTRLERLDLHNTRVSDEGLRWLASLAHLKFLRLDATAVTDRGSQELAKELPQCEIKLSSLVPRQNTE